MTGKGLLGIVAGLAGLFVVLVLIVWGVDSMDAAGRSVRNVDLDGRAVGGQSEAEVAEVVRSEAQQFESTPVIIRIGDRTVPTTAAKLRLEVDQEATVDAVMDVGGGFGPLQPVGWAKRIVDPAEVDVRYRVRNDYLEEALDEVGISSRPAVEPRLDVSADGIEVIPGKDGRGPDPKVLGPALEKAAASSKRPITVSAEEVDRPPAMDDEDLASVADEARELSEDPITVHVVDLDLVLEPKVLRSALKVERVNQEIEATLDDAVIEEAITEQIAAQGVGEAKDAEFTVQAGTVKLTPAVVGVACCPAGSGQRVADAIEDGATEVTVEGAEVQPELSTEKAEALKIVEPVGGETEWKGEPQVRSFTTYYAPGEPRVVNIHRIADLVRGTLVLPGESFSVNDTVGERTKEKGFVEAGAIREGEHVTEFGGGVSQFATTAFNAAFFAGLPIDEYRSHSESFSRYPYGREATMGWPDPDLRFTNDTPYGILVWTSYTDTSVTVTLYSTQYASAQQTGQSTGREGRCTTVETERTITYEDGRTAKDSFKARYRDPDRTTC